MPAVMVVSRNTPLPLTAGRDFAGSGLTQRQE